METTIVTSPSTRPGSSSTVPFEPVNPAIIGSISTIFTDAPTSQTKLYLPSISNQLSSNARNHAHESIRSAYIESTSLSPHHEYQNADESADNAGPTSKGPKTGMIVGMVVVVVLTLIVIGFCVFDCRRRFKRRKKDGPNREDDVDMWEAELQNGRNGQRNTRRPGLWDKLKMGDTRGREQSRQHVGQPTAHEHRSVSIIKGEPIENTETGDADRVGPLETSNSKRDNRTESLRYEREPDWLPAYMPRERASIVSSVGSMNTPLMSIPVISKVTLEEASRLGRHRSAGK